LGRGVNQFNNLGEETGFLVRRKGIAGDDRVGGKTILLHGRMGAATYDVIREGVIVLSVR